MAVKAALLIILVIVYILNPVAFFLLSALITFITVLCLPIK